MINNIKKSIFLLFLLVFVGITNVSAATKNIEVTNIEVKDKSGTITVVDPVFESNEVKSNITFNQIDDFVTFELTLKNNESEKYKITSITDNNTNENIQVEYSFNKDFINTGDTSKVTLKLTYKNKLLNIDEISLNDLTITLNLESEEGKEEEIIINPVTGDNIFHYLVLLIIALVGIGLVVAKKKVKGIKVGSFFVVLAVLLLPFAVFANEKYEITIKFDDIKVKGEFETYNISIDPGNGTPVETRQITYGEKLGDLPANPTKDGYTFDKWVDEEGNEVTKDTVISKQISVIASYNLITYNITYDLDEGSLPSEKSNPDKYTIESQSITLNNPEKQGYTFAGWSGAGIDGQTTEVTIDHGSKGDRSYKAHYLAKDDTKYTVIHKFQKLTEGYDEETVEEHGTTGSTVPAPRKTRTGFITPAVQNVTIEADESASVTYVYDRETYAFSITDRTYVDSTSTTDGTYPYGTSITVKAIERPGYGFAWSDGNTEYERTFELSEETNLTPEYTAKTNTPYVVNHYKMDIDGEHYTIADTQNLSGTTDSPISPAVNTYEGFTSPQVQSTTINGDGSTVVNYYYTRNQVTVTFTNTEYIEEEVTSGLHYYGEQITLTTKDRDGYTFTGWTNGETSNPLTITVGTSDIEIGPLYKSDGYTVTYNANGGNFYDSTKLKNIVVYTEKQDQTDGKYETEDKYLNPTKTDNAFKGWYIDSECTDGNEFDIDTVTLTGDIEVYAKWQEGTAMFIDGPTLNSKINNSTTSFSRSTTIPEEYLNDTYLVSTDDSEIPIYMWYDEDTKESKWYSDVTKAYLNPNSKSMFYNLINIQNISVSGLNTSNVTDMSYMFRFCRNLIALDLSSFDTSNVTNMAQMFEDNFKLSELNVSSFNTSNVNNMMYMFSGCNSLEELNLSNFATNKVTNMQNMFSLCNSLTSLNLGDSFDTSKVTNMSAMFQNCSSLTSLDLGNSFDTSKVTNMERMFVGCSGLTELNVSNFNTSSVTNMKSMFQNCSSLVELDLSNFNTGSVTNMKRMFKDLLNLETIRVSDLFLTTAVTDSSEMFTGSESIVGGAGTTYDANHIDKEYAHIDGGVSNPGYFTGNITEFTVTFETNGGSSIDDQMVSDGEKATRPATDPTKNGYTFVDWYKDSELTIVFDFNTPITEDTTIYAKWKKEQFPVVFSHEGECTFNGSDGVLTGDDCEYANGVNKYIDTGINLYNITNINEDYEIGFTIVSYDPDEQESQATLMNTKLEGSGYPGVVFRKRDTSAQFDISSKSTSTDNVRKYINVAGINDVKIYRIYNSELDTQEIFYSINDGEKIRLNDLSQSNPIFNLSVWFGAAPKNATGTEAQRYLKGTLSNMYIKVGTYGEERNKFEVTFDTDGGSNVESQIVRKGGVATRPLYIPTKTGYSFVDWYADSEFTTLYDFTTPINDDTTIYAKFEQDPFSLVFSHEGECTFNGKTGVLTGDNCAFADGIRKYIDTGVNLYNSENHDKDYEIGFTIVSYSLENQDSQATFMNTKYEADNYPGVVFRRRTGDTTYDLSSRKTTSANVTQLFDFGTVNKFKLYRIYNSESDVQEIFYSINDGEKVKLNDLSKFNPEFDLSVWFGAAPTDAAATDARRYLTGTLSDMYIKLGSYQEEESTEYTVTLNPNGGSVSPTSITHEKNVAIGELPTPTAPAGKIFTGWYTGLTDGIKVTSTYIPSGNITIYARYTDLKYTVTFDTNGGSEVPDQEVTYGGKVTRPATDPTKTGLEFDDWYTDNTYTTKFDFDNTTITIATTIYGNFTDPCNGFSADSWSTIKNNLESDSSYYAVGCEKEVELNMDNDSTPESYTVRLANTSTPEVCSTEGYSQTACGTVIEFVDIVGTHNMNSSDTTAGGWKSTAMVTYLNSDFYNKIPAELQSVIIPTYPIVSGYGSGNDSPNITEEDTTKNKIYLLSGREVGFDLSYDNKRNVITDTRTLDYYVGTATSGSDTKRIKNNSLGNTNIWWLRSAYHYISERFYSVNAGGGHNVNKADGTYGVAPAFRIGTMPEFTVSFDTDGGSTVASQTVSYGSTATRPTTDPTKTGYTFDDWYTDDTYTTKFDFDTPITSNTTIYAKFDELNVCAENENITRLSENTCSNNENITVGDGIVCKRAVKLHEETCSQTSTTNFCSGAGYTTSGSKGTSTITYGSCGTSGTLTSGDAFTCDVNGDEKFDELTERFYYVSDYYDTSAKEFDDSTAVLIYYNNVTSGVSCNKNNYVYDNISVNTNGPRAIKIQLPTTSQWSNISLINTSRQILTEAGTTSTTGGVLSVFSYEGYAARFVTTQELSSACNITELRNYTSEDLSGNYSKGELDGCNYIMENTKFANASLGSSAIYLETPSSSANNFVWVIHVYDRFLLNRNSVRYNNGARPVIEVPKTKISY